MASEGMFARTAEADGKGRARIRVYEGPAGTAVKILLALWAVFQLWAVISSALGTVVLRIAHVLGLIIFTFLLYPPGKQSRLKRKHVSVPDGLLIVLSAVCLGYMIVRYPAFARSGRLTDPDVWAGAVLIVLVFEAARRTSGKLIYPALLFFSYFALWGRFVPGEFGTAAFTFRRIVKSLAWDTIGILGTGTGVSATYIFVFVLFGTFLTYSGFSALINDLALALAGRSPGGPAKVSVIASALMGMINGSAVANVATTGVVTIPLMKKTGYRKEFAAAVEAVSSTGGQFTPPIMGAVGFVMAEFMAVGYTKVLLAAAIPAFLYYLGLMVSVHLEAKRLGLTGLSADNIPKALEVLKARGHLLLPPAVLFILMLLGFTPLFSAVVAMILLIPVSWIRKETRMGPGVIFRALAEGSRSAVTVGVCCALIGVIIGSVNMTGLGVNFGALVLRTAGEGRIFFTGLLVMVLSVVLGMGVPGIAAYVIVYAVAVPALRSAGVTEMAANMFCLIYACLANITPPVAISSYVASGIAGSDAGKTSLIAVRLGAVGFIVPFFFLGNPVLLYGSAPASVLLTVRVFLSACAGVLALSKGLSGFPPGQKGLRDRALPVLSRAALIAAGLMLISASVRIELIALGLAAAGLGLDRYCGKEGTI